jgi:hypothetical protein
MSNNDKNVLITPNKGQVDDPKIEFVGANTSTAGQTITLRIYPSANGTLSFEGSAGQLFSITNDLADTIFSVNDISGIPSIEVNANGTVKFAEYSGNILIGTDVDNGDKFQVNGNLFVGANNDLITNRKKITVQSRGFAGLELLGDTSNEGTEPGGAYITLSQDGGAVSSIFGIVQNTNQNGSGGTYTGTTTNSLLLGHNFNTPLHLGTNQNVRMTISGTGEATFTHSVTAPSFSGIGSGLTALNANNITTGTINNARTTANTANSGTAANTIALRDSAGDIFARFLNMNHSSSSRTTDTIFYSSSDSYIRKNDLSGMRSSLGIVPSTGGTFTGNINVNNTAPTIRLQDTDHLSGMIHMNSDIFYILRGNAINSITNDSGPNGRHPMTLNFTSGDATFSGNVTAYSDERLKKDIEPLQNSLSKVMQLSGVTFARLDDEVRSVGVIAQQVREVLPEVVREDLDGYLHVAYGNMAGLFIEAIKELKNENDELKELVKSLVSRIENLENRN